MENPFKYGGIVRGPHFADRKEELSELVQEMDNLSRVFLISPRRFGKTCLLFNLMERLNDLGFATAYLDLNAHPDVKSLAAGLTHLTSMALESNFEKLLKVFSGLQKLRPKVSVGQDGSIMGTVEVAQGYREAIPALLEGMQNAESLAQKKGVKLVILIDEFSDLLKYDGQTLEKAMRSEIQRHDHVGYIFSGSDQSIMLAMARDRKRAFYKLGRLMTLGPIERNVYLEFIHDWFHKARYKVKKQHLEAIMELGKDVPYNVQRLCNTVWELAREKGEVTPLMIEESPAIIGQQDSPHFELLWQNASQQQKMLLFALSKEPDAKPFSRDFQMTHEIGPSSSIKASLESLKRKGILFKTIKGSYQFSDVFMKHWIRRFRSTEK
jgi:hypothetical protein